MDKKYVIAVAEDLQISTEQVRNTMVLLEGGATIPFISRYRKEMTGSLDEVMIASIRDRLDQLKELDKRRETILKTIEEQGNLTDELSGRIVLAQTMSELEDLYLPYKPKRKTRASMAKEKGLESLAKMIMSQPHLDPAVKAESFINAEKGVESVDEALAGARDIIAEWINENTFARSRIRKLFFREGVIKSKVVKGKEMDGLNYKTYYEWQEKVMKTPTPRFRSPLLQQFLLGNEYS